MCIFDLGHFQLIKGLSGLNPILRRGRSVIVVRPTEHIKNNMKKLRACTLKMLAPTGHRTYVFCEIALPRGAEKWPCANTFFPKKSFVTRRGFLSLVHQDGPRCQETSQALPTNAGLTSGASTIPPKGLIFISFSA